MNSLQLSKILNSYRPLKGKFLGVFASNNIHFENKKFPFCFVANTKREGTAGEHWIACWASNHRVVEFFDSFGEPPPEEIANLLRTHFPVVKRNKQPLQSPISDACGHYCVVFLVLRLHAQGFEDAIHPLFLIHPQQRDQQIKNFVQRLVMG